MQQLTFNGFQVVSYSDQTAPVSGGHILSSTKVSLEFGRPPKSYYRHGWQSWSLTTWHEPDFPLPTQKPAILHPLQTDPVYARQAAPNGSWLGAVEFEPGKILLLGALDMEAHVAFQGQQSPVDASHLNGWYEADSGDWFVGYGDEQTVFARYAELLGERLGSAPGKPTPRVWCSWYSLRTAITQDLLHQVLDGLGDLPFDVFQIDDGWQISVGDWEPNEKFPSGMEALAAKIRASDRTPGLWLAPLLVLPSSTLFRQHPDWLLRKANGKPVSAGINWGERLYALDTTHPEALDWLKALMKQVRAWGFDYLKLDFLYAGALPGKRHEEMPREAAYRQGLQVMREAMGEDAYFLACGAPIIPSLGLCDALRVGPDVSGEWENYRNAVLLYNQTTPGTRNAIRTSLNRLWLNPLVATDPDVTYFSSQQNSLNAEQKRLLQDLALVCNFKATSDLPQWLREDEREELRAFLEASPKVKRTGSTTFELDGRKVDFKSAVSLPEPPGGLTALRSFAFGLLANQGWALKLMDPLGKRVLEKRLEGSNKTDQN
jgi:alpha-galactosidase